MVTRIVEPTGMKSPEQTTTGYVISKDGAAIGYRQFGYGPGVILLHGASSSGYNHKELAEALSYRFTVYVPDRRGRGLSGPFGDDYNLQKEVEDLDALISQTGAHNLFGVSVGGIIALQAALTLPAIHKAAIYEPPLAITQSNATAILRRFDEEMAQGRIAAALVTGMKGAQMGPAIFNIVPRPVLELLVKMAMNGEDKKGSNGYVSMRELAPTLHYDFQLVVEALGKLETFKEVRTEVLLLGGSKSPAFLKTSIEELENVLPNAKRVEFSGLDHAASWNTDRGGSPEAVAEELHRFFA